MPLGDFVAPGTLPKPLSIGRAGRFIFGVGALFYFAWVVIERESVIGSSDINVGWLVGVVFAFYYLPDLFVVGLSRPWGRRPQVAVVLITIVLLAVDFAAYGAGWAPPLSWGVFILSSFFFGLIGIAFLVAAALAVPG